MGGGNNSGGRQRAFRVRAAAAQPHFQNQHSHRGRHGRACVGAAISERSHVVVGAADRLGARLVCGFPGFSLLHGHSVSGDRAFVLCAARLLRRGVQDSGCFRGCSAACGGLGVRSADAAALSRACAVRLGHLAVFVQRSRRKRRGWLDLHAHMGRHAAFADGRRVRIHNRSVASGSGFRHRLSRNSQRGIQDCRGHSHRACGALPSHHGVLRARRADDFADSPQKSRLCGPLAGCGAAAGGAAWGFLGFAVLGAARLFQRHGLGAHEGLLGSAFPRQLAVDDRAGSCWGDSHDHISDQAGVVLDRQSHIVGELVQVAAAARGAAVECPPDAVLQLVALASGGSGRGNSHLAAFRQKHQRHIRRRSARRSRAGDGRQGARLEVVRHSRLRGDFGGPGRAAAELGVADLAECHAADRLAASHTAATPWQICDRPCEEILCQVRRQHLLRLIRGDRRLGGDFCHRQLFRQRLRRMEHPDFPFHWQRGGREAGRRILYAHKAAGLGRLDIRRGGAGSVLAADIPSQRKTGQRASSCCCASGFAGVFRFAGYSDKGSVGVWRFGKSGDRRERRRRQCRLRRKRPAEQRKQAVLCLQSSDPMVGLEYLSVHERER